MVKIKASSKNKANTTPGATAFLYPVNLEQIGNGWCDAYARALAVSTDAGRHFEGKYADLTLLLPVRQSKQSRQKTTN
jgi:hypothetical protein